MEKRRIRVLGAMVFIGILWMHAGRGFVLGEEIFYQCDNRQLRMENYDERLKELGADEFVVGLEEVYQLFPKISGHREEIEDVYDAYKWVVRLYIEEEWDTLQHCLEIFHFCPAKGQDNYIFLYMEEGTGKFIYPYFMQRNGDSFTEIETVSLLSDGEAKIMQFGENT